MEEGAWGGHAIQVSICPLNYICNNIIYSIRVLIASFFVKIYINSGNCSDRNS